MTRLKRLEKLERTIRPRQDFPDPVKWEAMSRMLTTIRETLDTNIRENYGEKLDAMSARMLTNTMTEADQDLLNALHPDDLAVFGITTTDPHLHPSHPVHILAKLHTNFGG